MIQTRRRPHWRVVWLALFPFVSWHVGSAEEPAQFDVAVRYGRPVVLGRLENAQIRESSGIAASRRHPQWFWTHNDSGDQPQIFAFDQQGHHRGTCRIAEAQNVDWEDMASFTVNGIPYLLLADTGDNALRRDRYTLYLVREPADAEQEVRPTARIDFRFEDGPHDCEAVAMDVGRREVVLIEKSRRFRSGVYVLDMKNLLPGTYTARRIADIFVPLVTGMDISSDGRRAAVATYGPAFAYQRAADESWKEAFQRGGRPIAIPVLRQCEAVCFDTDGRALYFTTEKTPTPLIQIPTIKDD